jgi:hypothetical protein
VKPLAQQIAALARLFPNLDTAPAFAFASNLPALPEGAEGWLAIPRWEQIAAAYNPAVEAVLTIVSSTRVFTNNRAGELGPDRLRQSERRSAMLAAL